MGALTAVVCEAELQPGMRYWTPRIRVHLLGGSGPTTLDSLWFPTMLLFANRVWFGAFCQLETLPFLQPVWSCRFCCGANSQAVNSPSPASPSLKSPVRTRSSGCRWLLHRRGGAATFNAHCLRNTKRVSKLSSFQ